MNTNTAKPHLPCGSDCPQDTFKYSISKTRTAEKNTTVERVQEGLLIYTLSTYFECHVFIQ